MSSKPIHAEIVRADQVKAGEKYAVLTTGRAPLCSLDDATPLWTRGAENEPGWVPGQIVARIPPEPAEVLEFWRVTRTDLREVTRALLEMQKVIIGRGENAR